MATPLLILVGADKGGVGKPCPVTSKVLTPSGWRLMGDMKVGDAVCGTDGKTYQASGVYPKGRRQKLVLRFTDGTCAPCAPEHLWTVRHATNGRRDGWVTRSAEQLRKSSLRAGDYFYYRIPMVQPVSFASGPMPIDPYVLGVLIGDGYLTGPSVRFSAPPAKDGVRLKVESNISPHYRTLGPYQAGTSQQFSISRMDKDQGRMMTRVRALGLDVKSKQRFVPEVYKTASHSDRLELLRGLMDTDGSSRDGRTSFGTCSPRLAEDVADLVRSLGGIAVVHRYDRESEGKPIEWDINVRMNECPFSLDYKAAHWKPAGQLRGKYIASIDEDGEDEMQCIMTTAPNSLYVMDGYNATHNTTVCRALCDYMAQPSMANLPRPRVLDCQYPRGDLIQFHPEAQVINVTDVRDQMKVFDALEGTTIVDVAAGLLGFTLSAFDEARLLDDVRAGLLRVALLHVLGPTLSSLHEIGDATAALGTAASHFIVKNHVNETTYFEWDEHGEHAKSLKALEHITVDVPHLDATAAEAVQQARESFIAFAGGKASRTLRGRVARWLERSWQSFDKVGLGAMIGAQ